MAERAIRPPAGLDWDQGTLRALSVLKDLSPDHANGIAAIDLFVVPTVNFKLLFGLVILRHDRRLLVHVGNTSHPTAEWISRRISEAFPWKSSPACLIRYRDAASGEVFKRRLRAMGVSDCSTAQRTPWQNGYVECLIGSIRRECLDHVITFSERHLRRGLVEYFDYDNTKRPHRSLRKDTPTGRPVNRQGEIRAFAHPGGLHHILRAKLNFGTHRPVSRTFRR